MKGSGAIVFTLADAGLLADIAAAREADRAEMERLRAEMERLRVGMQGAKDNHERARRALVTRAEAAEERLAEVVARVEALAEGIKAGTDDFMAGFEKAGEGISTRMSGETAAMVVQVRCEMQSYVAALLTAADTTALDAVKAQAAREALLAAADDYERERIERHEIVIAALDSKYDNGVVSGPAKFLRARADQIGGAK